MSLDKMIQQAVSEVPECVAAGYVDLSTGMLIAIKTVESHPSQVIDLLAAATAEMFQGPNVTTIENIFKKSRGVDSKAHYFQEMVILSDNLIHVMIRGKQYVDHVSTFVCRRSVNLGMALTKARAVVPKLEAAL